MMGAAGLELIRLLEHFIARRVSCVVHGGTIRLDSLFEMLL